MPEMKKLGKCPHGSILVMLDGKYSFVSPAEFKAKKKEGDPEPNPAPNPAPPKKEEKKERGFWDDDESEQS